MTGFLPGWRRGHVFAFFPEKPTKSDAVTIIVMSIENFDTGRFISEIQIRPCLWDTSCDGYSNRELKKKEWDNLVELFWGEDLSPLEKRELGDSLQKKWKSLRGCYVRELRRQKFVKSGIGTGPRKSEYIFFKQLHFLQNVVTTRDDDLPWIHEEYDGPGPSVVAVLNEESAGNEDDTEQTFQYNDQKNKKSKRSRLNTESDNIFIDTLNKLNKSIERRESRERLEEDEDRMFLLSLLTSLKSVPVNKKMGLKINMMNLINEAIEEKPLHRSCKK